MTPDFLYSTRTFLSDEPLAQHLIGANIDCSLHSSLSMVDEDLVDLLQRELVQSYDPGMAVEIGWQYAAGVLLARADRNFLFLPVYSGMSLGSITLRDMD